MGADSSPISRARRRAQYVFFYTPLSGWVFALKDKISRSPSNPRDLYPHGPLEGDLVEESGRVVDASRGIGLDYDIVRPATPDAPMPIILMSVPMDWGPGRRPGKLSYLTGHLARAGYFVIRVRHTDADQDIISPDFFKSDDPIAIMDEALSDPERPHQRFLDIPFLIDRLTAWNNEPGTLQGKLDMDRIGICGHSYGARTAFALLGHQVHGPSSSYKDRRIKAGISYSVTQLDSALPEADFVAIDAPVLHFGGTRDVSWSAPCLPVDRFCPYKKITSPGQYRVVMQGLDHNGFTGGRGDAGTANQREQNAYLYIRAASLAFWDAYLRGDADAERWLKDDFPKALGRTGRLEWK